MGIKELMSHVDHTLLAQTATWEEIRQICDDAVAYQTASVRQALLSRQRNIWEIRWPSAR